MHRGTFVWTPSRRRGAAALALLAVLITSLYLPFLLQADTQANVQEDDPDILPGEPDGLPLLGPPAPPISFTPPDPLLVGVLADTGVTKAAANNVAALAAAGAEAFLGLGDYAYWEPVDSWAALMAPLLALPHHLVLGNHDDPDEYAPYVGANGSQFSVLLNGARFIGLDTDRSNFSVGAEDHQWLVGELSRPEPVKVLLMHKAWWLGPEARHPGVEFPGDPQEMDALVEQYGVTLVLAGHEHNYQRANRANATFVINGAGGQSVYSVKGAPSGTVASSLTTGHLLLSVTPDGIQGTYADEWGHTLDTFALTPAERSAPATFQAHFLNATGNDWWVEVRLATAQPPSEVAARVDGGPWRPLNPMGLDKWGRSLRAPEGSRVELRAIDSLGNIAHGPAYVWPPP